MPYIDKAISYTVIMKIVNTICYKKANTPMPALLAMSMFTALIQDSHSSPKAVYLTHQNTQSQPFACMNGPLSGFLFPGPFLGLIPFQALANLSPRTYNSEWIAEATCFKKFC